MALYSTERALIIINDMKDIAYDLESVLDWNDVYYAFLEVFDPELIESEWDQIKAELVHDHNVRLTWHKF